MQPCALGSSSVNDEYVSSHAASASTRSLFLTASVCDDWVHPAMAPFILVLQPVNLLSSAMAPLTLHEPSMGITACATQARRNSGTRGQHRHECE